LQILGPLGIRLASAKDAAAIALMAGSAQDLTSGLGEISIQAA
jgi:hypothetical protein